MLFARFPALILAAAVLASCASPAPPSALQLSNTPIAGGARAPQLLVSVAPRYPASLRATGDEAKVVLKFTVAKSGSVEDARVIGSTNVLANEAALTAVRQWKFKPSAEKVTVVKDLYFRPFP